MKQRRIFLFLLILAVLCFCFACGRKTPSSDTGDSDSPTKNVSIEIVDLEGKGTQDEPYLLPIVCGNSVTLQVIVKNYDKPLSLDVGGDCVTAEYTDGSLGITAVKAGTADVILSAEEVACRLCVTVENPAPSFSPAVTGVITDYYDSKIVYPNIIVCLTDGEMKAYSKTNEDGVYFFADLQAKDYTLSLLLDGDYSGYVSSAREKAVLESGFNVDDTNLQTCDFSIVEKVNAPVTRLEGKVTSSGFGVREVTVYVDEEHYTTTDSYGNYDLEGVYAFDNIAVTVLSENDSYATYYGNIAAADIAIDATTSFSAELGMPFSSLGIICGNSNSLGYELCYTRSNTAYEFLFKFMDSSRQGNVQLYIDTKASTYNTDRTDYLISTDGKNISVSSFDREVKEENLITARAVKDELGKEKLSLSIPYAFFKAQGDEYAVGANDVIGIASVYDTSSGKIGWLDSESGGGREWTNSFEISAENPVSYKRLNKNNENYRCDTNIAVDFSAYKGKFAMGESRADVFYVNASLTSTGLKLDFMTTGNFGGRGETDEFVALFLDLDGIAQTGWNFGSRDLLLRMYGNGTIIYKSGSPWWVRTDSVARTITNAYTVNYSQGITTFTYTVPYTLMGISQGTTFGFALREAYDTSVDMHLYGNWTEFVYNGQRVGDTAFQNTYIKSTSL